MHKTRLATSILLAAGLAACGETSSLQVSDGTGPSPKLPEPNKTLIPTVNIAPAVGWPEGGKPQAAPGTQVATFAEGLDHPRWLYVLPNGDVLVAETNAPAKPEDSKGIRGFVMEKVMSRAGAGVPSANRISLLRDKDGDGVAETRTVFIANLNSPFGMALIGDDFYVADTDKLLRFHYEAGVTSISGFGEKVVDLPGGPLNHHWTKNVIASPDGKKLYVTVGSNSNVGENGMDQEEGRAAIWEVDAGTGQHRIFASGLRNPNGMAWEPESGKLWTAVNERDEIGSDLVPDYITSVKDGGFYGWPYSYYGPHIDVRVEPQNPELVAKAISPDYAVGPHTASLGLSFAQGSGLPAPFTTGA
jgi:glucose/arabinose dehydrogenase